MENNQHAADDQLQLVIDLLENRYPEMEYDVLYGDQRSIRVHGLLIYADPGSRKFRVSTIDAPLNLSTVNEILFALYHQQSKV